MQSNAPRYEILKDSYLELQSQMEAQFLQSAIEQVELFLKYSPGHALAHNDLGVLYHRKGDKLQALGHHQKANRLAPENLAFQKCLANFYLKEMGWEKEACALYQEVLQAAPNDQEALLALAAISSGAGKAAEGRAFLERIVGLQSESAPATEPTPRPTPQVEPKLWSPPNVTLATATPQPAPFVTEPARAHSKSPDQLYLEARGFAENGNTGAAIESMEQLLTVQPDHALAHNDLGVLYLGNGATARALEHHKKACTLEPDNGIFAENLVGCYLSQGMTDEAIFALLDQLKRSSEDIRTLSALGNICLSVDRPQEALIFFEKVLALEPWNHTASGAVSALRGLSAPQPPTPAAPAQPDAMPFAAAAALQPGDDLATLDELLARLRTSPTATGSSQESAETMYGKALQAAEAGRRDDAIGRLEALAASYPDFAPAQNDLGVLYYQGGDLEHALARHRQAVSLQPGNLDFRKNLAGLCLTDAATSDEGILLLTEILKSHPGDMETLLTLGRVSRDLERPEEAKIFLRRLLEYEPWHKEAQELLKQMSQTSL